MSETSLSWKIENILAREQFNEIYETAVETCLSEPERLREISHELALQQEITLADDRTRQLGLWGIKASFENSESWVYHFTNASSRQNGLIPHQDVIKQPQEYSAPPDPEVQLRIEAFGKALVEESFACLGEDAEERARRFASDDIDSQVETLDWLCKRICEIRDNPRLEQEEHLAIQQALDGMQTETSVSGEPVPPDDNTESDTSNTVADEFYHPIRLSPKAIGTYPETLARPTCLGISVLAASFFERAGGPYLHTGVAETAVQNVDMERDYVIGRLKQQSEQYGLSVCQKAANLFEKSEKALVESFADDNGHHAAVLAKLNDKYWMLMDPNFRTNVLIPSSFEGMNERYEKQRSLNARYPGVDTMMPLTSGGLGMASMYAHFEMKQKPDIPALGEVLVDAYQSDDPYEVFESHLLERTNGAETLNELLDLYMQGGPNAKVKYLRKKVEDLVHSYVFPDVEPGSLHKSLERCASDSAYFRRRIEDLHFLPHYFVLSIAGNIKQQVAEEAWNNYFPHTTMEVGVPHFRIGACVLSDFDVYSGGHIPLSFWQANWSSHISFEDHVPSPQASRQQRELGVKVANNMRSTRLRYYTSRGITKPFLEQEGAIDNGDSQQ